MLTCLYVLTLVYIFSFLFSMYYHILFLVKYRFIILDALRDPEGPSETYVCPGTKLLPTPALSQLRRHYVKKCLNKPLAEHRLDYSMSSLNTLKIKSLTVQ